MDKLKLAACGIDCTECGHYKVEQDLKAAEYLVEYFRSGGWIGENEGAEAVLKKVPLCRGCWDKSDIRTQCCAECGLRACCEEKQLYNCGECSNFPCEKYIEFVSDFEHHKKAMEYLLSLKQARKGEET